MTIASLLAVLLWLPWAVGASGNPGSAIVRGTVQLTGERQTTIAGATVTAYSDVDVQQTTADASGRFIFLNLLPGVYHFYAAKSGFNDCHRDATEVELSAGQEYDAGITLDHSCS